MCRSLKWVGLNLIFDRWLMTSLYILTSVYIAGCSIDDSFDNRSKKEASVGEQQSADSRSDIIFNKVKSPSSGASENVGSVSTLDADSTNKEIENPIAIGELNPDVDSSEDPTQEPAQPSTDFMLVRRDLIYGTDFAGGKSATQEPFQLLWDTRLSVTNEGYLRGVVRPADLPLPTGAGSAYGTRAWVSSTIRPSAFIMKFKVRFFGGDGRFEIGHWGVTVELNKSGLRITTGKHPPIVRCSNTQMSFDSGQWHDFQVEKRNDEFLIAIDGKFAFYLQHNDVKFPGYLVASQPTSGLLLMSAKSSSAMFDLDDYEVWSVKPGYQDHWQDSKAGFAASSCK